MTRTRAALVLAVWIAGLAALGIFVQAALTIRSDLRFFLPTAATAEQRLLLEGIGEGPASRVLVIALEGASAQALADASRALAAALRASASFRAVANGEPALESFPHELLPYRFLLSPTLDGRTFDAQFLAAEFAARLRELASPVGLLIEPWLARDPTLELMKLAERWQPLEQPRREYDVWFDRAGKRALLIAETRAPAFDPDRQRAAIEEIERTLAAIDERGALAMTVSGTGQFSAVMEARTRTEAQRIGRAATIGVVVLLLVAYRRLVSLVLALLPLASGALAGLAAVSALFGSVHGITLAFGFTLIGVAQDYPIHLLSHARANADPRGVARALWPTLATGIVSTCVAYATFLVSGVLGLAQLAVFTVAGLAIAGLATRFALPPLVRGGRDYGDSIFLRRAWAAIVRLPHPAWAGAVIAAAAVALGTIAPQPLWDDDLSGLTPVPAELLEQDAALRGELGTADVRYMLVARAADEQTALHELEALEPALQALVASGAIGGYDHAARYLPAAETQRARQARLPETAALRALVTAAQDGTQFRAGVFEPFVADVARARELAPLTIEALRDSALGTRIAALIEPSDSGTTALVTLSGVRDVVALANLASATGGDVTLLDLKRASESLVARQRARMLMTLGVAGVLLVGVVAFALRSPARVLRVVAPMALTTAVILAVLQTAGISLNLFHLISLILAAGLGLDYALFFERAADDAAEQARTLHAVLVCAASTLFVFALLAASSLPVLRAIGMPVAIGVVSNFVLALLVTRTSGERRFPTTGIP